MDLLGEPPFNFKRDFFAVECNQDWECKSQNYMEPEGVSNHIRALLKMMPAPAFHQGQWYLEKHFELVPGSLIAFWTGHSARHTFEEPDYLGRWACAKHGS